MGLASSHTCSYGAAPGGLLIAACDPNTCGGSPQGGTLGPGEEGGLGPKCEEDPGREPASPTCVVEQPLEPGRPLHLGSAQGQDGGHTRTGPQNPGGGMKDPPPPPPPWWAQLLTHSTKVPLWPRLGRASICQGCDPGSFEAKSSAALGTPIRPKATGESSGCMAAGSPEQTLPRGWASTPALGGCAWSAVSSPNPHKP